MSPVRQSIGNMARAILLFLVLILPVAGSPLDLSHIRSYYEWGQYDSVIINFNQAVVSDSSNIIPSEYYIFYGVALYAQGKISDARKQFVKAYSINQNVTIDKRYVSDEITDLFYSTISDYKAEQIKHFQQDSILKVKDIAFQETMASFAKRKIQQEQQLNTIFAVVSFSVTIATGILTWYEYDQGEQFYKKFNDARVAGDTLLYVDYRNKVNQSDIITGVYLGSSVISALCGGYFTVKWARLGAYKMKMSVGFNPNSYCLQLKLTSLL